MKNAKEISPDEERTAALAALREKLPDGVSEALRAHTVDGLSDLTAKKWLAANGWDVKKTAAALKKHADWRKTVAPSGRIEEEQVRNELAVEKTFLQGLDRQGRPLTIVDAGRHDRSKRVFKEFRLYVPYAIDAARKLVNAKKNPEGRTVCIFDLTGYGLHCADPQAMILVFDLLSNHYPNLLGTLYMYEAPKLFYVLWKVVSPFVSAELKSRIKFIYAKDGAHEELCAVIPAETLPKKFGGAAEWIPVQRWAEAGGAPGACALERETCRSVTEAEAELAINVSMTGDRPKSRLAPQKPPLAAPDPAFAAARPSAAAPPATPPLTVA